MTRRLALIVTLLVSARVAHADSPPPKHAISVGSFYAATGATPSDADGYGTFAIPTVADRYWTDSGKFNVGSHFEGFFAAMAAYGSFGTIPEDQYFVPMLGIDAGVGFGLAGGRASINGVIELVGIKTDAAGAEGDFYGDLGLQLHYTREVAKRVRVSSIAQGAFSGGSSQTGGQVSLRVDAMVRITSRLSAFGSLAYDWRKYGAPDDMPADADLSMGSVMLRIGGVVHSRWN